MLQNTIIDRLARVLFVLAMKVKARAQRYIVSTYPAIDQSVKIGANVQIIGPKDSFEIGRDTYINEAIISAGEKSKVIIGERCAIGYRVSIKAITHDVDDPCGLVEGIIRTKEATIVIGDDCWIGDGVFIREGVTIGDNVIVGANSVVTKSVPSWTVVAGAPAVIIEQRNH
ncbi:MAG: acyltransferase [Pseudomonadales bacterium]